MSEHNDPIDERLASLLEEAGRLEQEDLAAAQQGASGAGDERIRAAIQERLGASGSKGLRKAGPAEVPRTPLRLVLGLVAAGIAVSLFLWTLFGDRSTSGDPGLLGPGFDRLEPVGRVEAYERFSWSYDLAPRGWFVVEVYSPDGTVPLSTSERLPESRWTPSPSERQAWPDRIRWIVRAHDASGREESSASSSAFRSH